MNAKSIHVFLSLKEIPAIETFEERREEKE
jgi:hypothetical protein